LAGETKVLEGNLTQRHFLHHKSHLPDPGANPGRRGGKAATNRFNYGTATQFGFRKGKGTRNAIGMLRRISERTLDIFEEICIFCIDCQKAFDHVKWTKLMEILKKTGIDWCERRLIANCTWIRVLKYG
jgi:hypothetical protein